MEPGNYGALNAYNQSELGRKTQLRIVIVLVENVKLRTYNLFFCNFITHNNSYCQGQMQDFKLRRTAGLQRFCVLSKY